MEVVYSAEIIFVDKQETSQKLVVSRNTLNRHKPSGIASTESILRWHLVPTLGAKRLDAITNEQVQRLKLALSHRAPKTVNNVLTVLSTLSEEGRGMGRARAVAVRDQVVAQTRRSRWGSTTSRSTSVC